MAKRVRRRAGASLASIPERLANLDPHLLGFIRSQSSRSDRDSLLTLHLAATQAHDTFAYLEIGSHLGGSLQGLVVDDRCTHIVSIDPRPEETPDDRGKLIPYPGNSTARMLERLRDIPGADMSKVQTIESATADIDPASITIRPQLAFIDGQHTHEVALSDARFCGAVMRDRGCLVLHDIDIVGSAVSDFLRDLQALQVQVAAYPLPDKLFAVEMGRPRLFRTPAIQALVTGERNTLPPIGHFLARSASDKTEARALLLDAWLSLGAGRPVRSRADKERIREAQAKATRSEQR